MSVAYAIRSRVRGARRIVRERRYATMTNAQIFADIYRNNLWGGTTGEFYSGSGSTSEQSEDFSRTAKTLITDRGIASVVDVGCGDFRVGRAIVESGVSYLGIDVVPELIAYNNEHHAGPNVSFRHLDITVERPPRAGLAIIRQVFQHLSNDAICAALKSLTHIPLWLVAEHFPNPDRYVGPNLDKPTGDGVRALRASAVSLADPPFDLPRVELLTRTVLPAQNGSPQEEIRIFLVDNS